MTGNVGFAVYPMPLGEQVQGVHVELIGEALDGLEREIPFAALQTAHVGTVHVEHTGEVFLTEPTAITNRAQIAPESPLQVPFHSRNESADLLLERLQTYE